ncbi:hypothetical protein [Thermospira aquatica]|uniref:Lipoprotein n=1 Tax=Thermospira aquatica TaxID=2828656 RepID=A0AAX3BEJ6_9SPIR|nr:hypothetical protein [Thermospira aquatica]URA10186.1 hypothetical protein KDW03_12015 [Thermospira aquatica]
MRKAWVVLLLGLVFVGCEITTVEHRYKQRFDHFYGLLNDKEKAAFRADDFVTLGKLLDERMSRDKQFSNAMDAVMFDEAIHTFRMDQVGMFFKRYILTGFHQDDYQTFVNMIPKEMLVKFIENNSSVVSELESLMKREKKVALWWKKVQTDGRLGDFSPGETLSFYRWYIFPERTRSQVYYVVKFLSEQKLLGMFLKGDEMFFERIQRLTPVAATRELRLLKSRAGLERLSDGEFFRVYRDIVFKEMDQVALKKTLAMFPVE